MTHCHVGPEPIDLAHLARLVSRASNGAVVSFAGTVRDMADGRAVIRLEYSAYLAMAQAELAAIVTEASELAPSGDIAAEHRVGTLELGDVSVAIAVGHPHRGPAFDACRYIIEQIKQRVPIWKREHYADGASEWVSANADAGAVPVDR
jgi:molybdopterin synthase catalytic subunit